MKLVARTAKLSLSVVITIIASLLLAGVIFTEDLRALAALPFRKLGTTCPVIDGVTVSSSALTNVSKTVIPASAGEFASDQQQANTSDEITKNLSYNGIGNNGNGGCSDVTSGNWVFNASMEPLYTEQSCPYLSSQMTCKRHGRIDSDYMHWEWKPDNCSLPRFDAKDVLDKLRGKRLLFVGDSILQEQWLSLVCLIESMIPHPMKVMIREKPLSVFHAKEYNATIEFYWAPFLVRSNSDLEIEFDTSKRVVHVDSISEHGRHWIGADILIFETYVWWLSCQQTKAVWKSFANIIELDVLVAYTVSLKTWADWVDSNVNPHTTRVFFTTMSPTHMRSEDWGRHGGIRCFNETRPVAKKGYWGTGSDPRIMAVVKNIIGSMKVPVTVLNVTQMSDHRIDGHVSVYTTLGSDPLTKKQKANPEQYADCIHWCLPGVPDSWNQLLYAYL